MDLSTGLGRETADLHTDTALRTIRERSDSHLRFNVMPGRSVEETLRIRRYVVGDRYAEAHFDRSYHSEMRNSPSHLIFLSALIHTQKLLYVALCEEWGLEYDPEATERFKMWPTKVEVQIPELIEQESGLVQKLWIKELRRYSDKVYKAHIETRIGSLVIRAQIPTFRIDQD